MINLGSHLLDLELSPKNTKDYIGFLKMLLKFAVQRGSLKFAPQYTVSVKSKKKPPKALTEEERDLFLEYAKQEEARYHPILAFTVFTGTRMGEARSLTWGDVKLNAEVPYVRIHSTLDEKANSLEFKGTKNEPFLYILLLYKA